MLNNRTKYRIGSALFVAALIWVAFFGAYSAGPSYRPSPGHRQTDSEPQADAANKQQHPDNNQRGTPEAPLIVKVLPPPDAHIKATEDAENEHAKARRELWLVSLTGLLAVATIALACYTAKLWTATNNIIKEAAKTSARDLRAYVSLGVNCRPYPAISPNRYSISLSIRNGGKTWGTNAIVQSRIVILDRDDISDPFSHVDWSENIPVPLLIGPQETIDMQWHPDIPLCLVPFIPMSRNHFYYVARIKYKDVVGSGDGLHETQLSRKLNGDDEYGISFSYMREHNCADGDCRP